MKIKFHGKVIILSPDGDTLYASHTPTATFHHEHRIITGCPQLIIVMSHREATINRHWLICTYHYMYIYTIYRAWSWKEQNHLCLIPQTYLQAHLSVPNATLIRIETLLAFQFWFKQQVKSCRLSEKKIPMILLRWQRTHIDHHCGYWALNIGYGSF